MIILVEYYHDLDDIGEYEASVCYIAYPPYLVDGDPMFRYLYRHEWGKYRWYLGRNQILRYCTLITQGDHEDIQD